jgi:hypothetical protein
MAGDGFTLDKLIRPDDANIRSSSESSEVTEAARRCNPFRGLEFWKPLHELGKDSSARC